MIQKKRVIRILAQCKGVLITILHRKKSCHHFSEFCFINRVPFALSWKK